MIAKCPKNCSSSVRSVRFGRFRRKSDSKYIQRWRCKNCGTTFSAATNNPCFGQNKRRLNSVIYSMLNGKTSQRRIALLLGINRKTVARKIRFLGLICHAQRQGWRNQYKTRQVTRLQFDDMITTEHTKCKPVAISLLVAEKSRKILDFEVSPIAARGPLARISRKKYGLRKDLRTQGWNDLFQRNLDIIDLKAHFKSDMDTLYPKLVRKYFPQATHQTFKGRRAAVVGQGEMKACGFDPLFDFNHTAAMIRDGLARLVRKTWCTTKKLESLSDQLEIYIDFHNRVLTA